MATHKPLSDKYPGSFCLWKPESRSITVHIRQVFIKSVIQSKQQSSPSTKLVTNQENITCSIDCFVSLIAFSFVWATSLSAWLLILVCLAIEYWSWLAIIDNLIIVSSPTCCLQRLFQELQFASSAFQSLTQAFDAHCRNFSPFSLQVDISQQILEILLDDFYP